MRACLRVQADRGFIQKQDVRRVQQPAGDLQPPHHTAGEGLDPAVPPVPQIHHVQDRLQSLRDLRAGHPVQLGVEAEVPLSRQIAVERRVLEHQPDRPADLVALMGDVVPGDGGRSGGRPGQGAQHVDGGGLPGPVRAEEAEPFALCHVQVEAVHGRDPAGERLGQAVGHDGTHPADSRG